MVHRAFATFASLASFLIVSTASAAEPVDDGARVRFGIYGGVTAGYASGTYTDGAVSTGVLAPHLNMEFGVQTSRHFGLFLRGEAATVLLLSQAALYAVAEYTPVPILSVGVGAGFDGMQLFWADGCESDDGASGCIRNRNNWSAVSVPLSVALNFSDSKSFESGGRRVPTRLQLEVAPGVEPTTGVFGGHAALSLGASWM